MPGPTDIQSLLLQSIALVDVVVATLARNLRLRPAEAEDLAGAIRLKLLEHDNDLLRRFEGRSSLRTYLVVIARRQLMDQRTALWGRWRPCIQARRAGAVGILLDRLLNRDGFTFDEACQVLRSRHSISVSSADLYRLSVPFPSRSSRRFVDFTELENAPTARTPGDDLEETTVLRQHSRLLKSLKLIIDGLPREDRLLLRLRYKDGLSVAQISRVLNVAQKPLYRDMNRILKHLRRELDARKTHTADPPIGRGGCATALARRSMSPESHP